MLNIHVTAEGYESEQCLCCGGELTPVADRPDLIEWVGQGFVILECVDCFQRYALPFDYDESLLPEEFQEEFARWRADYQAYRLERGVAL